MLILKLCFFIPRKIIFLVEILAIIDKYFKESQSSINLINNQSIEFHLIFVSSIDSECQSIIEKSIYHDFIKVHYLNMDIYTIEYDLISIEEQDALKDLYIDKNYNCLSILGRSILKFQTVFGKIKYKYIKGTLGKKLYLLKKDEKKIHFHNDNEI